MYGGSEQRIVMEGTGSTVMRSVCVCVCCFGRRKFESTSVIGYWNVEFELMFEKNYELTEGIQNEISKLGAGLKRTIRSNPTAARQNIRIWEILGEMPPRIGRKKNTVICYIRCEKSW